jgi:hypothetical protein
MRRLPCPGLVSTPNVKLTDDEQKHLFTLIHKGHCHQDIHSALEVSLPTVLKIHERFAQKNKLQPWPKQPWCVAKVDDELVACMEVIETCMRPPGAKNWTACFQAWIVAQHC